MSLWEDVLYALKYDISSLHDRLDWAIKLAFLEDVRSHERVDWNSSLLRELDIRYHDIHPEHGLFYILQREGIVRRMVNETQINHYLIHAPDDTRAKIRTTCLEQYGTGLSNVEWDRMESTKGCFEWPDTTVKD